MQAGWVSKSEKWLAAPPQLRLVLAVAAVSKAVVALGFLIGSGVFLFVAWRYWRRGIHLSATAEGIFFPDLPDSTSGVVIPWEFIARIRRVASETAPADARWLIWVEQLLDKRSLRLFVETTRPIKELPRSRGLLSVLRWFDGLAYRDLVRMMATETREDRAMVVSLITETKHESLVDALQRLADDSELRARYCAAPACYAVGTTAVGPSFELVH